MILFEIRRLGEKSSTASCGLEQLFTVRISYNNHFVICIMWNSLYKLAVGQQPMDVSRVLEKLVNYG